MTAFRRKHNHQRNHFTRTQFRLRVFLDIRKLGIYHTKYADDQLVGGHRSPPVCVGQHQHGRRTAAFCQIERQRNNLCPYYHYSDTQLATIVISLHGDTNLVNGAPWQRMAVAARKYRLRILHASVSRGYRQALSTGQPFTVIATDGGLMPAPVQVKELRIGMAERYEIIIDFSKYALGTKVVLKNLDVRNSKDFTATQQIMRFDVERRASDDSRIPATLHPNK